MIISHEHQFVMIKTEKTAGTSLEIALSRYLGPSDVITPLSPNDEDLRRELGHRTSQNYYISLRQYELDDWRNLLSLRRLRYFNHAPATFIQKYLGSDTWNKYYKFAFERNPWDKAISMYWYRRAGSAAFPSVSDYIASGGADDVKGFDLYTINNEVVVNCVFLYEDMQDALQELATRINLPEVPVLPNAKGDCRQDRRHHREVLSQAARDRVMRAYEREIAWFGYEF